MRLRLLLAAVVLALLPAAPIWAADLPAGRSAEPAKPKRDFLALIRPGPRPYPLACDNPRTLEKIVERFAWAEKNTWRRGFTIARIEQPRLRYEIAHGPSLIDHTHCQARAVMTNGSERTLYFTVEEGMGLASIGTGVDFCILGLDPWFVHDAACRTLR